MGESEDIMEQKDTIDEKSAQIAAAAATSALKLLHDDVDEASLDIGEASIGQCVKTSISRNLIQYNKTASALNDYLTRFGRQITEEGDETFNFVDQHGNKKWFVPDTALERFYAIIEEMRVGKIPNGFSERQNKNARFFIDFDIVLKTDKQISHDESLISSLIKDVARDIMTDAIKEEGSPIVFNALAMARDRVTQTEDGHGFKDGIHLYYDIMASQPFRKHVMAKMVESKKYTRDEAFGDLSDNILNTGPILDKQCASVIPMLLGATKSGGTNYSVLAMYQITCTGAQVKAKKLDPVVYSQWNLVSSFCPSAQMSATKTAMIHPVASVAKEFDNTLNEISSRLSDDENENISIMSTNDPTAREIQSLLKLLSPARFDNFDDWSKILLAVAHWGDRYKSIARVHSMRSAKYKAADFEFRWSRAMTASKKYTGAGIGTLVKFAKVDDPAGYKKLTSEMLHQKITNYIFEVIGFMDSKTAHLGDYQIADIIHSAFPNKYIAVPKRTTAGKRMSDDSDVSYYSLMMPENIEYRPGWACKYLEIFSTAPIQLYISQKVPIILKGVKNFFYKKREEAEGSGSATQDRDIKSFNVALGIIGRAYSACQNHGSKGAIMRQFAFIATNHQFEYELDIKPYVMGIYDALLEIGPEPRIIRGPCDHRVSRTSLAKYRAFDPDDKYIIAVTQWMIDFVPDDKFDKFLFLLLYMCQAMTKKVKQLGLLNISGGGQNAKSTILFLMNLALGLVTDGGYGYKMSIDYLTQTRTNSSSAQSEVMPLKDARFTLLSEPGANQPIIENKLKTLLSGESLAARDLYGKEQNIVPASIFVVGSNADVKMESGTRGMRKYAYDFGTIRRVGILHAECTFLPNPDPTKPNQRKSDSKIFLEHIFNADYQGAFLSLLSMAYSLFLMQHNEEIMTVRSPNVAKETDAWRRNFDTIDAYINAYCVINPVCECRLEDMVNSYIMWHDKTYSPLTHDRDQIAHAFVLSKMEKYIKTRDNVYWVIGIRFISDISETIGQDEVRFMRTNEFEFKTYEDYVMPQGFSMPFKGKIAATTDARTFLHSFKDLHTTELAAYRLREAEQKTE